MTDGTSGPIPEPQVLILNARWFRVLEDFEYRWDAEGYSQRIRILRGFEFDGASVPELTHFLVGRLDLGLGPPAVHDALYRCRGDLRRARFGVDPRESGARQGRYAHHEVRVEDRWEPVRAFVWSRRDIDRLFGRHMRERGVVRWRRRLAYGVVRLAGWTTGGWR